MTDSILPRLVSPTHRRIFEVPEETVAQNPERFSLTAQTLIKLGWRIYAGPAVVDGRGWVIPGTDLNLSPIAPKAAHPHYAHGKG